MISTVNSNANRISGLASGMDTETLVEQLTSGTTAKIESAYQQKELLEWKQDAYREVINKLNDFNNTYFGSTSGTILFGDSLGKPTASVSDASSTSGTSSYVSVVPGSSAQSGSVFISDIVSLATGAKVSSSSKVSTAPTITVDTSTLSGLSGKALNVTLDGVTKTLTFAEETYSTAQDVQDALQTLVDDAFGSGRITISESGGTLSVDAQSSMVTLKNSDVKNGEASSILSFTDGASNRLKSGMALSDLSLGISATDSISFAINGESFTFTGSQTLGKVLTAINSSKANVTIAYSNVSDTFTITSKETGAASAISYSDTSGSFLGSILGEGVKTAGTNAVIKVGLDGSEEEADQVTLTRSTNTFDINGSTYTLNGKASGTQTESVSVKIAPDTDTMVDKIVKFVDDYNKLLASLTDKINEEYDSDYLPLTDDQKEKMSDSDEALWTEKAKTGLLRNDLALTSIASSLRSAMYASLSSLGDSSSTLGVILSDIGITTGAYTDYGQLTIDEDKLRASIAKDPQKVLSLFTQKASVGYSQYNTTENKTLRYKESGLAWRINDIVKNNLSQIGKKGALIELVGSPANNFTGSTTYSKKISNMESTIYTLEEKLINEQDRYWTKFTAMEKSLQSLNSQSSWLTQMLSK